MKPTHIEHIGIAVKSLEEEQKKNAETVLTNTATWKLISEDASRKSVKDIGNILEQEVGRDVMTAVKQLPDKQRVVVLLHYTQDYSTGEIAGILHIPRGTVLSRLAKARQNIRSYLEGRGYEI